MGSVDEDFLMSASLTYSELNADHRELVEEALGASAFAYAPYSGFAVGAAVRTTRSIITGANLENASYPLGICAEVCAIAEANSRGEFGITSIAIVGHKFFAPKDISQVVTPCGRCRQVIFEASQVASFDIIVLSCDAALKNFIVKPISKLLPMAFGPKNLGLDKVWPAMRTELGDTVRQLRESFQARRNLLGEE
jgi:cytidine deaminase